MLLSDGEMGLNSSIREVALVTVFTAAPVLSCHLISSLDCPLGERQVNSVLEPILASTDVVMEGSRYKNK